MNQEQLVSQLESIVCEIHKQKATINILDGQVELSGVCCASLNNLLKNIIDEHLHQRYMDDLDNLFS